MFTPDIGQALPSPARDVFGPPTLPAWLRFTRRADTAIVHVGKHSRPRAQHTGPHILSVLLSTLDSDLATRAIVLTGKCAFADCEAWPADVLEAVAACERPTVAAIPGDATGPGLALALACGMRVAMPTARFALPGIRGGGLPASRTIARLARLVALPDAVELMAFGAMLSADKALACGLLDIIAPGPLLASAVALGQRGDARRPTPFRPRRSTELRTQIQRRAPGQQAPLAALEALEHALAAPNGSEAAIDRVRRGFVASEQGRAIRAAVGAEARILWAVPAEARPAIGSALLLEWGASAFTLGASLARAGVDVTIANEGPGDLASLDAALAQTFVTSRHAPRRIRFGAPSGGVDLILAGPGTTAAQWRDVRASLDQTTRVLADPLAPCSGIEPSRCASMHIFAPGGRTRLIELGDGPAGHRVPALIHGMGLKLLQRPPGARGILVERLRWPMLREAIHLLDEGATPRQVDTALLSFGFTAAPFAALDREGLAAFAAGCVDGDHAGPAWHRFSPTLDMMLDDGRLGVQHGLGWYRYEPGGRTPVPAPELDLLLRSSALAQRLRRRDILDAEIVERCLAAAINEAFAVLHEGEVEDEDVIDAVWTGVIGFPRWRGGLLRHARQIGLASIATLVARVHDTHGTIAPPHARLIAASTQNPR